MTFEAMEYLREKGIDLLEFGFDRFVFVTVEGLDLFGDVEEILAELFYRSDQGSVYPAQGAAQDGIGLVGRRLGDVECALEDAGENPADPHGVEDVGVKRLEGDLLDDLFEGLFDVTPFFQRCDDGTFGDLF